MTTRKPKIKVHICKYSHCKHESKEIKDTDEYIKPGKSAYYHPDCYQEKKTIDEIIDVFANEVNEDVVFSRLRSVINDLVYNKNKSPDYLLFGLRYFIKYRKINYPSGLYYIVEDRGVLKAWEEECRKKLESQSKDDFEVLEEDMDRNNNITIPTKNSGFQNILGV